LVVFEEQQSMQKPGIKVFIPDERRNDADKAVL
jgi:hypothetical protein